MTIIVPCLYVFSMVMLVIKNFSYFLRNLALHCINTRQGDHWHRPLVSCSVMQKGIMYSAIKVFNKLPICIR
jgi:hypothetical protein